MVPSYGLEFELTKYIPYLIFKVLYVVGILKGNDRVKTGLYYVVYLDFFAHTHLCPRLLFTKVLNDRQVADERAN